MLWEYVETRFSGGIIFVFLTKHKALLHFSGTYTNPSRFAFKGVMIIAPCHRIKVGWVKKGGGSALGSITCS